MTTNNPTPFPAIACRVTETRTPHTTYGIAQAATGEWFSLSEEAFSSGACMHGTAEEARIRDEEHHAFMVTNHPDAIGRDPFITRKRKHTLIEIDSSPFVRSHMKDPRGRGSWAFSLEANPRDVVKNVVFSPSMTWGEAKVWARQWFRDQQAKGVYPLDVSHVTLYAQP